jgi:sterol 3beta-glucosyltransferase
MKITILTVGSRGDVQPFVALGLGLQQTGHLVTLCTGHNFQSFVEGHGLPYAPLTADFITLLETPEGRAAIEGKGRLPLLKQVRPMMRQMLDEAWTAVQQAAPDRLIYHPKVLAGYHLAEKLGIPGIHSLPLPLHTPTREFPILLLGDKNLGGWLNKQSYKMMRGVTLPFGGMVNEWRKTALDLPPRSRIANEMMGPNGRPTPTLYAYSPHVVPTPDDWPDSTLASGYWFLDAPSDWQPPADLAAFLQAGPPPVYIGFGSMVGKDPARLGEIAVAALQKTGQRGLLASGLGGLQAAGLPDDIFMLESAPHEWLFPQVAAVIHHGGSGTTGAGLRAGKPTIICPFIADQPFWGHRVHELGVGPAPIPQKKLTVETLAAAIETAVTNKTMQTKAAELGEKIRGERGVETAVNFIENCNRNNDMGGGSNLTETHWPIYEQLSLVCPALIERPFARQFPISPRNKREPKYCASPPLWANLLLGIYCVRVVQLCPLLHQSPQFSV